MHFIHLGGGPQIFTTTPELGSLVPEETPLPPSVDENGSPIPSDDIG